MRKCLHSSAYGDQKGVTVILVAVLLIVFLGFAALAIDIGYTVVTKNEVQNVSDAASLAATRKLGVIYETMPYPDQQSYVCDPGPIIAIAKDVGSRNQAAGVNISIQDADVIIGQWNPDSKTLTPTLNQPDAVKVMARRDDVANGPITTFFAKLIGVDAINVSADATAALTGESTSETGGLPIPVGIPRVRAEDPNHCNAPIKFHPTGDWEGCAGWHTFTSSPANASTLRDILDGLTSGTLTSPPTTAYQTEFAFIGGDVASDFEEMKALFDAMKVKNDGILDADKDPNTWTTQIVVYDSDDCSNPSGLVKVVGFATVVITEVTGPSPKVIQAMILCNNVERGRGSGGNYGTKGSIPGLVE